MNDAEIVRGALSCACYGGYRGSPHFPGCRTENRLQALDRLESQASLVPRLEEALLRIAAMASMESSIAREALALLEEKP